MRKAQLTSVGVAALAQEFRNTAYTLMEKVNITNAATEYRKALQVMDNGAKQLSCGISPSVTDQMFAIIADDEATLRKALRAVRGVYSV